METMAAISLILCRWTRHHRLRVTILLALKKHLITQIQIVLSRPMFQLGSPNPLQGNRICPEWIAPN